MLNIGQNRMGRISRILLYPLLTFLAGLSFHITSWRNRMFSIGNNILQYPVYPAYPVLSYLAYPVLPCLAYPVCPCTEVPHD